MLVLVYSCTSLALQWHSFRACRYPLHIYLLVAYCMLLLSRMLSFIASALTHGSVISQLIVFFQTIILYGSFLTWTVLGTFWFAQDHTCLHDANQYATFILWFVLCYLAIALYSVYIILTVKLGLFRHVFLSTSDVLYTPIPEPHLDWLPETAASTALLSSTCSICLEPFAAHQRVTTLPHCQHAFHTEHIHTWLRHRSSCPLCRSPVEP